HSGINTPAPTPPVIGKLGLRFDRKEFEQNGRLRVSEVIPLGPAAISDVKAGDYILQIDGTAVTAHSNLEELLDHKINRRVELSVSTDSSGANSRIIPVRPVNLATEKNLLYRKWVEDKREYVAKASGGRLGYVHMLDMSDTSLNQLYLDL